MILSKRKVLAGKIETVEGVAEVLTATEATMIAMDVKWTPDIKMLSRNAALNTLSKLPQLPGLALAHISFKTELIGREAGSTLSTTVRPYIDPYLRACGLAPAFTTGGTNTISYSPASTGVPTITTGVYVDGVLKKISGARGTVKFSGVVGEPIYAEFDFMGAYNPLADATQLIPTVSFLAPPLLHSANLMIGSFSPVVKSVSFDIGNKLAPREDVNSTSGYKSFMITDRDPTGQFDAEMETVATHNWYGLWKAGTSAWLTMGPVGTATSNKLSISAPAIVTTKTSEGDREGLEIADTTFQMSMSSGDDEFNLTFS
jgi:hypothetical protein